MQARLLQTVAEVSDAWDVLGELGEDVDKAYWAEFVPYGRGADFPHVSEMARRLLEHGRAAMAIDALSLYAKREDVDVEVVLAALYQFGTVDDPEKGRVSEHALTSLLDYLRSHGVEESEVALFEWKFLAALRYESKVPSLQRLLARDPVSFVQVIELAFKRAGSNAEAESHEVNSALASNAYRLLREWHVVPGTDDHGVVDAVNLTDWLSQVRALLTESDRLEIGELQVGEVLAYAPADSDGAFPTRPVRDALEAAGNDRLERGFMIGLRNKRGVTTRGLTALRT